MRLGLALMILVTAAFCAPAQSNSPEYGFLLERHSISSKDGIIGFPPGTRVEIVSRHGSRVSVKAEEKTFDVTADQITTDTATGNALRQQDGARQEALQQQLSESATHPSELTPKQQHSPSPANPHPVVNDRLAQIREQRERLKIDLERVKFEAKSLPPPNSSKGHGRHLKIRSSPNAERLANQRKEL